MIPKNAQYVDNPTWKTTYKNVTLTPNPDKVTTIVGKWSNDTGPLIDELGPSHWNMFSANIDGTRAAKNGKFNLLNIDLSGKNLSEQEIWEQLNKPWLEQAMARGDDIILASDPINLRTGFYERELDFIKENAAKFGYDYGAGLTSGKLIKLANAGATGIKVIDDFLALAPKIDNIAPSSLPTGYQIVTKNESKYIRRIDESNINTPRLMVDETGTIVQYVKPTRLSSNSVLRNRLKQVYGGTLPDGHQAHHIVPDNVVQNSPIYQEALSRGLYDIDRTSNGKLLAETAEDYPKDLTGASQAYPTHFGSHPNYDDAIRAQIDDLIETNDINIFNLNGLSDTEITNIINAIENRATNVLTNWQPSKLN